MNDGTNYQVTREEALAMVQGAQEAFGAGDVERILEGYTDDVIVRFADVPEMRGKEATENFLRSRFARQQGYELTKTLRMIEGNLIGNFWEGSWTDSVTGKKMLGRGTEFWTVEGGKVSVWEATFNVWEEGGAPATPIT